MSRTCKPTPLFIPRVGVQTISNAALLFVDNRLINGIRYGSRIYRFGGELWTNLGNVSAGHRLLYATSDRRPPDPAGL